MVLMPSTNGTRTSLMTKRKINPYAEFVLPCSSIDRTVYVTSSSNFHGLWGLWCKVEGMSEQDRQDVCEALLEEIFFCGYDFYDDWYPILSRIRSADVRSWLLGTRDGILFPGYSPAEFFSGIVPGVNPRNVWSTDLSTAMRTAQIAERVAAFWLPSTTLATGAFCGWEHILSHQGIYRVVVDILLFPWNLETANIQTVYISARKIAALRKVAECYSLIPIIILGTRTGILWSDLRSKASITETKQIPLTYAGLPADDEDAVGIDLRSFEKIESLYEVFRGVQKYVDVQEG